MTKTNRLREHIQRAILETCDLWDIWSEWWEDKYKDNDHNFQKQSLRLAAFETFVQSDEGIWPDQQKDNDTDKYKDKNNDIWDPEYNSDNWETEFMTNFVFWQLRVTLDSIRNSCDVLPFDNDITEMTISSEVWINSKKIQWYLQIIRYYPLPAGLMISDLLLLIFRSARTS